MAPVDTMGCDQLHDKEAEKDVQNFQTLITLMLSSQTRDEANFACMNRLKKYGLTVESMAEISESKLEAILRGVSFHKMKAKNIILNSKFLIENHDSKLPRDKDVVLGLKGVGMKMTVLIFETCWQESIGISVDTHVHRISNRL